MSRLLEDSEQIRENLEARNLYSPTSPYNLFNWDEDGNPDSPYLDKQRVANTVNSIAGVLKPFSSFDLTNTVLYRAIGPATPLAQIGLTMLAKQFTQSVASNASREYLPSIKFSNIFDGDPDSKFIMRKKDFQITRREGQTNVGRLLESITGVYDYRSQGYPFNVEADSAQFIRNSGKGQVQILVENIDRNVYKLESEGYNAAITETGLQISLGDNNLVNNLVFPFPDSKFYPFQQYISSQSTIGTANDDYVNSERTFLRSNQENGVKEYGNNEEYLAAMGKTFIRDNSTGANTYDFDPYNFGLNDNGNEQLVWGRDGVSEVYKQDVADLSEGNDPLGLVKDVSPANVRFDKEDRWNSFEVQTGILSYTRQLLNSKGKYGSFDLTRKKFEDTKGQLHFNGSPLDTHPVTGEQDLSRRHSMADPYDRFAKAIRFQGNEIYGGNSDSVINKSVIPKFAPSRNKEMIDNRNLMFSIENLAIQAFEGKDGVGRINDEIGTSIPLCEVGPGGGRLMWFPPYDVKLSESAVANWNNNQFIGRGEPIYTYNSSERLANLSFKLLIDYPPQLLNYIKSGEGQFHKHVAEFFAFGGEGSPQFDTNLSQKEALLITKTKELEELQPITKMVEPNIIVPSESTVFFPNDYPKPNSVNQPLSIDPTTDVEDIIGRLGYEDGLETAGGEINGKDYDLNIPFITDYVGDNTTIEYMFNPNDNSNYNSEGYPYLKIAIQAGATVLYNPTEGQEEYNKELSQRRQIATKEYLEDLIKEVFGKTAAQLHIEIDVSPQNALGSSNSNPAFNTAETIPIKEAKEERFAKIIYSRTDAMITKEEVIVGYQNEKIKALTEEIAALESDIKNIKRRMVEYSPCIFEPPLDTQGYEKGFKSVFNGRFYPTFHTQTPEDFHRRLTFLQQCTRQGAAVRIKNKGTNTNSFSSSKNSVFGRQPVCILRYGDFMHTKVVIDNISFGYEESTWDLNPEGFGMQPMIAEISMQLKIIGGQSLRTPIDALQNAVSFNYYANSTYIKDGMYSTPAAVENAQITANGDGQGLSEQDQQENKVVGKESNFTLSELQRKGLSGIGPPTPPSML